MINFPQAQGTLPNIPGLAGAMKKVHDYGLATGNESMVVLAPDGTERAYRQGDAERIDFDEGDLIHLGGCYLVHYHPVACPLSVQDILVTSRHGASGIMAVQPHGGFSAAFTTDERANGWDLFNAKIFTDVLVNGSDLMQKVGLTRDQSLMVIGHIGVVWALKKGLIRNYSYSYDPECMEAVALLVDKTTHPPSGIPPMNPAKLETIFGL